MTKYENCLSLPPIDTEEKECLVLHALEKLYKDERSGYGLEERPVSVFVKDLQWVKKFLAEGKSIVDAGSGTCSFSIMLAREGYLVTAMDNYSSDDLSLFRDRCENTGIEVKQLAEVLRSENKYDAVISICSLEHIAFPDQAILSWKRLLRQNGQLLIMCPNYSGMATPLRIALRGIKNRNFWLYRSFFNALFHSMENVLLNTYLTITGQPCFIRCMPYISNGKIQMKDADFDTVHLPSSRGIRNFLIKNGFTILSWRSTLTGGVGGIFNYAFPGLASSVRIVARLK